MNCTVKDLTGKTFGLWTVKYMTKTVPSYGAYWWCECECGTEREIRGSSLKNCTAYSCGCKNRRILSAKIFPETGSIEYFTQLRDSGASLIGIRFGALVVEEYVTITTNYGKIRNNKGVQCLCDCGNRTIVQANNLGRTHSCGCLRAPNLIGKTYGKITVTSAPYHKEGLVVADYRCECGNTNTVLNRVLKVGGITSCGLGVCHYGYSTVLTEEERITGRKYDEYYKWRKEVFERDNYRCVVCGATGAIHAHHILAYSNYPEFRTLLPNGITLCKSCHSDFHNNFGRRGDTNLMDLIEWNPLKGVFT